MDQALNIFLLGLQIIYSYIPIFMILETLVQSVN